MKLVSAIPTVRDRGLQKAYHGSTQSRQPVNLKTQYTTSPAGIRHIEYNCELPAANN